MNHGPGPSPSIVKILATAPIASFDPFSRSSLFYALCSLFSGNILDNGKVQCRILSCNGRNAFYPFLVLEQTYNISNSLTIEVTKPREIHFDESLFWQTQFRRFFSNQSMTLRNCGSLRYTAIRETTLYEYFCHGRRKSLRNVRVTDRRTRYWQARWRFPEHAGKSGKWRSSPVEVEIGDLDIGEICIQSATYLLL